MKMLVYLGLMASVAMVPGAAVAQAESGAATTSAGLAIATGANRAARSGMRGGMRMRGGQGMRMRGGQGMRMRGGRGMRMRGSRGGYRMRGGHNMRGGHRMVRHDRGRRHHMNNTMRRHHSNRGRFRHNQRFDSGTRFFVGGFLPSYFLAPQYYVRSYSNYGLAHPSHGHRWVRYYDDAYLVDDRGYISDYRYGVPFDGGYYAGGGYGGGYYGGGYQGGGYYDDRYYDRRGGGGGNAAAGAVIGGVIGGIAGNRIAGRGNRTEGTIIGAGLGAIAGAAIGDAAGGSRRDRRHYGTSYGGHAGHSGHGYRYDEVDERYYEGRRAAHDHRDHHRERPHDRGPVPVYVGDEGYYDAPPPEMVYQPVPEPQPLSISPPVYHPPVRTIVRYGGGANVTQGITQNANTTITINPQPAVTTTTTFIEEEVEYVVPRRRSHRRCSRTCN